MKRIIWIFTVLFISFALMTGCQKDTSAPLSDEELAQMSIQEELLNEDNAYLADWGIDDGSEENMYNGFSSFGGQAFPKIMDTEDQLVRFGRIIKKRFPRSLLIQHVAPDTFMVTIERVLLGNFVSAFKTDSSQKDSFLVFRKPLRHVVRRRAIFVKNQNNEEVSEDQRKRWKLTAISLSKGESRPVSTVEIHKIIVVSESGDTLVFNTPMYDFLNIPDDIPTFVQGEHVKVVALVSNSTSNPVVDPETGATETVLLHFGIERYHHGRKQFEYKGIDPETGYAIYEGGWTIHEPANRPFHAVVDVIDNGTIYEGDEQTYPYNSATWGCPYRVVLSK